MNVGNNNAQQSTAQISFIIPVYNVKPYLIQCLESIIHTNIDKEIILIDDGSTDGSLELLKSYQRQYSFITLVCQSNKGVSVARNIGIKLAKGEYLQFVDSDDYLLTRDYESLIRVAKQYDVDMLRWQSLWIMPNGKSLQRYPSILSNSFQIQETTDATNTTGDIFFQCYLKQTFPVVWLGFYRTKFIKENNILFQEHICAGEDRLFMLDFFASKPKNVIEIFKPFYAYRFNPDSLSRRNNKVLIRDIFKATEELHKRYERYSIEQNDIMLNAINRSLFMEYRYAYIENYLLFSNEEKLATKHLFTSDLIAKMEKSLGIKVEL